MTPTELELVASEELVEIRPTVKMDKIRFISVRTPSYTHETAFKSLLPGDLWPICGRETGEGSALDGSEPEVEEEMQCGLPDVVDRWRVSSLLSVRAEGLTQLPQSIFKVN